MSNKSTKYWNKTLGLGLRLLIVSSGQSFRALGEKFGIHHSTIVHWTHGKTPPNDLFLDIMKDIAEQKMVNSVKSIMSYSRKINK